MGIAGDAVQPVIESTGQAQLEHAEHGDGEERKEPGKRHEDPRRLQTCLEIEAGAKHAHQCAEDGEADRHRQHVGQGQRETAQPADLSTQDDTREDRQHR